MMYSRPLGPLMPALLIELSTALLLLGNTLATTAPGDESGECAEPDYPVNIKVLLDSWRYQTLLPQDDATNSAAVWTADESDSAVSHYCMNKVTMLTSTCIICMLFIIYSGILLECVRTVQLQCVLEVEGTSAY